MIYSNNSKNITKTLIIFGSFNAEILWKDSKNGDGISSHGPNSFSIVAK